MNKNDNTKEQDLFVFASSEKQLNEVTQGENLTFWKDAFIRFRKNKGAVVGMIMFALIILGMIAAPFVSPYYKEVSMYEEQAYTAVENADLDTLSDIPLNIDMANENQDEAIQKAVSDAEERISMGSYDKMAYSLLPPKVPGLEKLGIMDGTQDGVDVYEKKQVPEDYYFPFGTDNLGRDNFVRVFRGASLSIMIGLIAALLDVVIGLTIGGLSGYYGGKFDLIVQRFVDVFSTIPAIILLVLLSLYFSTAGKGPVATAVPIIMAIAITGWMGMNRIVRAQVLKLKEYEFVLASKTLGGSGNHIIFKHLLPNTLPTVIIVLMFTIPSAIFFEAFLSFLGLGIPAPYASLGTLVNTGRAYIVTQPYLLIYPALVLSTIMLSFNMMADGFRDALDPKMRGGK